HPAQRNAFPRRRVLRRHRHGGRVLRRRHQGPRRRAPGCRLRRGPGLPPGTGPRIAGGRRGQGAQYRRAHRPDRSRSAGLGRPACRCPLRCGQIASRGRSGMNQAPDEQLVPDLATALDGAEMIHDRATIESAIAAMADRVVADYADGPRPVFLTVMHGGLPFAARLALEIGARGLDLEFDYLHATRYRGATTGGELVWKHRPATPLRGRRVLLVDDILDEGHTLAGV